MTDQRRMRDLIGSDLVDRHVRLQPVRRFLVEGSREEHQIPSLAIVGQDRDPVFRHLYAFNDLVDGLFYGKIIRGAGITGIEFISMEVLKFDGIRLCIFRCVNDCQRLIEASVMVAAGFRDNEAGFALPDPSVTDPYLSEGHWEQASRTA